MESPEGTIISYPSRRGFSMRLRIVGAAHWPVDARTVQLRLCRRGRLGHPFHRGGANGYLADRLGELGRALAGFSEEIGSAGWRDTVVVVISEFGGTFRENGDHGTDHGRQRLLGDGRRHQWRPHPR